MKRPCFLHLQVSLVGQEPVLFARTVEENITYGLGDVAASAVVQAAIKANAHDFICTLPQQYQTCDCSTCFLQSFTTKNVALV